MLARQGFRGRLSVTDDLERAVDGADFVLIQIRVGGSRPRALRRDDPARLRLHRPGDDRRGRAGKALRTVPVVLEIAERVRAGAADGAWIVDFTNPVGIVTRALLDAGHRAVGLCKSAINFQRDLARLLGVEPERLQARPGRAQPPDAGCGACGWTGWTCCPPCSAEQGEHFAEQLGFPVRLLEELGAVPSYYLRYFYAHDAVLAEQLADGAVPRAQAVAEIERELLGLYRDPALAEKPALLEQRGGAYYSEAATGLVASLASGDGAVHVVDVRNGDTLAGLAADDVVEVPATWTATGSAATAAAAARPRAARARTARRRIRAPRGGGAR